MSETSPKLLDLMIQDERGCLVSGVEERVIGSLPSNDEEKKLELKLGLPCEEDWQNKQGVSRGSISSDYFNGGGDEGGGIGCGQVHKHNPWSSSSSKCCGGKVEMSVMGKDVSQGCYTRMANLQNVKNTAFLVPLANTAVPVTNTSQKRAAPTPVVGWPPIRSFRKNLASSSSGKAGGEPQTVGPSKPVNEKQATGNFNKGLFVKINMDGVPIGRKVDLNACNCYENLSSFVDTLFRGLLTALNDSSAGGTEDKKNEQQPITGLLYGTGEYTLVYEDNEGDRMLVGDVPWNMFVSTVKRLRVLKTSDLPTLRRGSKQGKAMVASASK